MMMMMMMMMMMNFGPFCSPVNVSECECELICHAEREQNL